MVKITKRERDTLSDVTGRGATTSSSIDVGGTITAGTSDVVLTTAAGLLKHEGGGIEADISSVAVGDVVAGTNTGVMGLVPASGKSDGDVLTLQGDSTADWETPASAATKYNAIADPDGAGSITMGANTGTYTSATDGWGGMLIANTAVDLTSATNLLSLDYTDDGDAEGTFLRCRDNSANDTVFSVTADGEVRPKSFSGNTWYVGAGCPFTTIDAAINACTSGDTILVAEGTYDEAITYDVDNLTIKALGSRESTAISRTNATVVDFSTKSGCVLEGFTVKVTAADGTTDRCITGANDDTSDYNYIIDCNLTLTCATAVDSLECVQFDDGNWEFRDCKIAIDSNYTGSSNHGGDVVYFSPSDNHTLKLIHCTIESDFTDTGVGRVSGVIMYDAAGTSTGDIRDCTFKIRSDKTTTQRTIGVNVSDTNSIANVYNSKFEIDCDGTGLANGFYFDGAGETINSYNNVLDISNADNDSSWADVASGSTLNSYGDQVIDGDLSNAGTCNIDKGLGEGTIIVGGGSGIDAIDTAMNLAASGDTILVHEGIYTETVTYDQNNITLKAIGSKENTIIQQNADPVVEFSTKYNCVLEGFTIQVLSADAAGDRCIHGTNNSVTAYNTIRNCDLIWKSSSTGAYMVYVEDGNWRFENCKFDLDCDYTGGAGNNLCLAAAGTAAVIDIVQCDFVMDTESTSGFTYIANTSAQTINIRDSNFDVESELNTTADTGIWWAQNALASGDFRNNHFEVDCNGTGVVKGIRLDTSGAILNSYKNTYDCSNADDDSNWAQIDGGATLTSREDTVLDGTLSNSGTANIYNTTDKGGRLLSATGVVIGQDDYDSTFHIDDASQGADTGTLYIGNAAINVTFTGKHYYQLGDLDLQTGELVNLEKRKLYRTTTKQDSKAIGIFWGITNSKDSFETLLLEDKVIDEEYSEIGISGETTLQTRKRRLRNTFVRVKDKVDATSSDFAYAVAVVGDSYDEHDKTPLTGAWVTIDNGVIEAGDFLHSSAKAGYLEKQEDNLRYNYTRAISREQIRKDTKTGYVYLLQ